MAKLTLTRTAKIGGVVVPVTVTGDILNETDAYVEMKLSEDIVSNLKADWKAGETVKFSQVLIQQ